jgi:hypothetical protein
VFSVRGRVARAGAGLWSRISRVVPIFDAAVDQGADQAPAGRGVTTAGPALPGSATVGELTGPALMCSRSCG